MQNDEKPGGNGYTGKTYAYIAIALIALSAVSFGLAFTMLGIYAIIASVLCSLAALAFADVQKRKNNFKRLVIIRICAYVTLGISVAFFTCGLIWSAIK